MRRASKTYQQRPVGFEHERWDCGVRALRVAANVTYAHAHAVLKRFGRRDRWGTRFDVMCDAAISLGLLRLPQPYPTLAQFIRAHPRGNFLLQRRGHFFALRDGVVHDWFSGRTGARSRIRAAWLHNSNAHG